MNREVDSRNSKKKERNEEVISRRVALKRMAYLSLSAATMMVLLNTQSAKAASNAPQAPSTPDPGGGGSPIWN